MTDSKHNWQETTESEYREYFPKAEMGRIAILAAELSPGKRQDFLLELSHRLVQNAIIETQTGPRHKSRELAW